MLLPKWIRRITPWIGCAALVVALTACSGDAEHPGVGMKPGSPSAPETQPPNGKPPETPAKPTPAPAPAPTPAPVKENPSQQAPTPEQAARSVLQALKDKDMEKLAAMAHPDKGVRFSPYAYIELKRDKVFKPDALKGLMKDNKAHEWGAHDGSGEPIRATFADYYKKFVFDTDFTTVKQSAVNKRLGQSNTNSNLETVYPLDKHVFVEYLFPGSDPKLEGMDWKSIRLVFERNGDKLLLVGIIHDQTTV